MSTTTATAETGSPATRRQPGLGAQLGRNLAAEWTKLVSVRSTVFSLLATAVVLIGFGILVSWGTISRWDRMRPAQHLSFQPATFSVSGVFFAQLVIGSLGVLAMSAEYSTGTIRATLSATPQRLTMYLTKVAVFTATAFVVAVASTTVAFLAAQAVLSGKHIQTSFSAAGVPRVVFGAALFLVAVALLGLGLAATLRHTAGAISTVFGLMLVLPLLSNFLPSDWQANVNKYLPLNAGLTVIQQHPEANSLGTWTGLGLMFGYALIALAAGAVVLVRRDA
jgi:ABC-type transport system involved in multi-copper enzyme maturation permease subunit